MVWVRLLSELAITALAATGATALIWALMGWLVRPRPGSGVWVVIPGQGDGAGLEESLRQLARCREAGTLDGWAVIWDRGLTPQGRELALTLARRWSWVSCCPAGCLEEWLTQDDII